MSCPRCTSDAPLSTQKINMVGEKVSMCENCKKEWTEIAALFRGYWSKVHEGVLSKRKYEELMRLFLNASPRVGPSERKHFAKTGVVCLSKELSRLQVNRLEYNELLVTKQDYAWVAGVLGAGSSGGSISGFLPGEGSCRLGKGFRKDLIPPLEDFLGPYKDGFSCSSEVWKSIEPYMFCSPAKCKKDEHPEELVEEETTWAWFAGCFDVEGELFNSPLNACTPKVKAKCKWRALAWQTFFGSPGKKTLMGKTVLDDIEFFMDKIPPYLAERNQAKLESTLS